MIVDISFIYLYIIPQTALANGVLTMFDLKGVDRRARGVGLPPELPALHIFPEIMHIFPEIMHIFPEIMHIFPEIMHIFTEIMHIFAEIIDVFAEAIDICGDVPVVQPYQI